MDNQGPKLLLANIVDSSCTAAGTYVVILDFRAPAHMLQLLSNSITKLLFDTLKRTESTLNDLNE